MQHKVARSNHAHGEVLKTSGRIGTVAALLDLQTVARFTIPYHIVNIKIGYKEGISLGKILRL